MKQEKYDWFPGDHKKWRSDVILVLSDNILDLLRQHSRFEILRNFSNFRSKTCTAIRWSLNNPFLLTSWSYYFTIFWCQKGLWAGIVALSTTVLLIKNSSKDSRKAKDLMLLLTFLVSFISVVIDSYGCSQLILSEK